MKKILILTGLATLAWLVPQDSAAATVPAGTTLIVKTLEAVTSTDVPGTRFAAQLANNVAVNGKVILPAGTKVTGKIATSRRIVSSTERLTVDLVEVQAAGRVVAIKTTGAQPLSNDYKTARHNVAISRAGYKVVAGKHIEFKLAQPLNF